MRDLPLFPLLPVGPIVMAASMLAIEVFMLVRMNRIVRSLDSLARAQKPPFIPA